MNEVKEDLKLAVRKHRRPYIGQERKRDSAKKEAI